MDNQTLSVIIKAVDKMSPILKQQERNLKAWKRQFDSISKTAVPVAAGFTAAMYAPAKAFANLESASVGLENTLMRAGGLVPQVFNQINEQAIQLSNTLPGTVADFTQMATKLNQLGVDANVIPRGALQSTAYLAVLGKDMGVTYDLAAENIGKTGNAFEIASNQLDGFADALQRSWGIGSIPQELQNGLSKVSGSLSAINLKGLKVANDTIPLITLLTREGYEGSEAGTGLAKIISKYGETHQVKNMQQIVDAVDKINHLPQFKRISTLKSLFGEEHWSKASLITNERYTKILKQMQEQASLQERIANINKTLTNNVETATGTWETTLAMYGKQFETQLKGIAIQSNNAAESTAKFIEANPKLVTSLTESAGALVVLRLGAWGASKAIGPLLTLLKTSPQMVFAQALVTAAPLIYENWDQINAKMRNTWGDTTQFFSDGLNNFVNGVKMAGNAIASMGLGGHFEDRDFFSMTPKLDLKSLGLPDLSGFLAEPNGMRPPGYTPPATGFQGQGGVNQPGATGFQKQSTNLIRPGNGMVNVRVSFDNAPAGLRVAPPAASGAARVSSVDVDRTGLRSLGNYSI